MRWRSHLSALMSRLRRFVLGMTWGPLRMRANKAARRNLHEEAERWHRRALEQVVESYGPSSHAATLSRLELANTLWAQSRREECEELYEAVLDFYGKKWDRAARAILLNKLGVIRLDKGKDSAGDQLRQSLEIWEQLDRPDTRHAVTLYNMGLFQRRQGRPVRARAHLERAVQVFEATKAGEHRVLLEALCLLGELYIEDKDFEAARRVHEQAFFIKQRTLGPDHPELTDWLHKLGSRIEEVDVEGSRLLHQKALRIREEYLGPDHPKVAISCDLVAFTYLKEQRPEECKPLYERALAINQRAYGKESSRVVNSMHSLAIAYLAIGESSEAVSILDEAIRIQETSHGPDYQGLAISLNLLSMICSSRGEDDRVRELVDRAVILEQQNPIVDGLDRTASMRTKAFLLLEDGDEAGAYHLFEQILEVQEQVYGPDHPEVATTLFAMAPVLQDLGDHLGAHELKQRAAGIGRLHGPTPESGGAAGFGSGP